jgi:putative glutamine amidotransferase
LLAAGLLGWMLWRNRERLSPAIRQKRAIVIWLLQSALIAFILLLLWQPAISVASLKPQQNIVAVVVDDSTSMAIRDDGGPRLEEAVRLLNGRLLSGLRSRFQVRLYRLGTDIGRIQQTSELQPSDTATHIGRGLRQIATDAATLPIGAVVLLSDGQDNSRGIDLDTLSELRRHHLPVNTIGFGKEKIDDVEMEALDVPSKALVDARLEAQVTIRQSGFGGKRTRLSLTESGTLLASRDITLSGSGQQIESIEFNAGKTGAKNIEAHLDPVPGEENKQNNQQIRVLSVDGAKRRILYIEGEPRWDYKFIRRAVEDDPALQVVSILRTTQNKIYRQGIANPDELANGFPGVEELFGFQGLMLGSVEASYFTPLQQELMKQFVDRRGGGLLFLGGRTSLGDGGYYNPPMSELLPVTLPAQHANTFRRDMAEARLTEEGKRSLVCRIEDDPAKNAAHWQILPYLANYQDAGTPKAGAVVLADMKAGGRQLPLLITENYGRGRTAVFATGGSWRWRMQQPKEDTSQQTFWRQLLRWTVSATPSRVTSSTPNPQLEDDGRIQLRAEVRDTTYLPAGDAEVAARVIGPDGSAETVPLRPEPLTQGIYSTEWNAGKAGSYVAEIVAKRGNQELGSDVLTFRRENGVAENYHHEQNRELLERLATETGGRYYRPRDANKLLDEISYSEAGMTSRETKDLWDMPAVFLAILSLRAAEWLLRRKWGVV